MITLHIVSNLMSYAAFLTGLLVLALGDWRKFRLKFAAVAISTSAAFALILLHLVHGDIRPIQLKPLENFSAELYHIARNTAFIIFHVAVGRDAIKFKMCDRRGCAWMRKS